jgi:hypothetical protein
VAQLPVDLYVIERRYTDGKLDLAEPQPESYFGERAITGITADEIAKAIFRQHPDAVLTGDSIPSWPRIINAHFVARRRTW